jgi:hypothetical protein
MLKLGVSGFLLAFVSINACKPAAQDTGKTASARDAGCKSPTTQWVHCALSCKDSSKGSLIVPESLCNQDRLLDFLQMDFVEGDPTCNPGMGPLRPIIMGPAQP